MNKNESKYFNTARLMDEALLLLLDKKEYEFITVKEICQKAGVNRSTFYLHYEGVEDLFRETVEMISKRFFEAFNGEKIDVQGLSAVDCFLITPKFLTPYLNFILQNKRVFRLLHTKPKLFGSETTFNRMYAELFVPILRKFGTPERDIPYIFGYYVGGITSVVKCWAENDCDKPVDELVALIMALLPRSLAEGKVDVDK